MVGYVLPVAVMRMVKVSLYSPDNLKSKACGAHRIERVEYWSRWLPLPPYVKFFGYKLFSPFWQQSERIATQIDAGL